MDERKMIIICMRYHDMSKNEAIAACIYIYIAYISNGRNPHVGFR